MGKPHKPKPGEPVVRPPKKVLSAANYDLYFKNAMKIQRCAQKWGRVMPEEGAQIQPFRMRPIQSWYHRKYVVPAYMSGEPIRHVILKCRQTGFSTYINFFAYWCTVSHRAWNSLVIGQDDAQMRTLFRMTKRFDTYMPFGKYEGYPEFPKSKDSEFAIEFKVPSRAHRGQLYTPDYDRDDLYWTKSGKPAVDLDSRIEGKSAEKKGVLGRAGTYQTVHASEAAFWPDLTASLGALLSCAPDKPQTAVFLETTANGMNAFHGFWQNLRVGNLEVPSLWRKIFIPWYWDERYELPLKKAKRYFEDAYEEGLFKRIAEDKTLNKEIEKKPIPEDRIWAKLFWRRRTIMDKFLGDIALFKQEFPATDAEAFMFTGVSVYPAAAIRRIESQIKEPVWRGNIEMKKKVDDDGKEEHIPTQSAMEEHEIGRLKIFAQPKKFEKYVIFADVAEGKAVEGLSEEKSKWDFSCAPVLQITSYPPALKMAAVWHGNCDPDQFGYILVALARYYNNAFLGWEINGPGRSLRIQIVDQAKYRNIYMREDYDSITKRLTNKPGWRTTARTKPDMVAVSQRFVRSGEVEIYDAATLNEMKAFSRLGENKYGAAVGHDDRVIGLAGALTIVESRIELIRRQYKLEEKKRKEAEKKEGDPIEEEEESYNPILGTEF